MAHLKSSHENEPLKELLPQMLETELGSERVYRTASTSVINPDLGVIQSPAASLVLFRRLSRRASFSFHARWATHLAPFVPHIWQPNL